MKIAEMKTKSPQSLQKHADKLRTNLAETRAGLHMGETNDVKTVRALRKELARTLTVLNEQVHGQSVEDKEEK